MTTTLRLLGVVVSLFFLAPSPLTLASQWVTGDVISAAYDGDVARLQLVVGNSRRSEVSASNGFTPLHAAALRGHIGAARFLLEHGAPISPKLTDARSFSVDNCEGRLVPIELLNCCPGDTPLHMAANREIAALLLRHGADPGLKNADGKTATQTVRERYVYELPASAATPSVAADVAATAQLCWQCETLLKEAKKAEAAGQRDRMVVYLLEAEPKAQRIVEKMDPKCARAWLILAKVSWYFGDHAALNERAGNAIQHGNAEEAGTAKWLLAHPYGSPLAKPAEPSPATADPSAMVDANTAATSSGTATALACEVLQAFMRAEYPERYAGSPIVCFEAARHPWMRSEFHEGAYHDTIGPRAEALRRDPRFVRLMAEHGAPPDAPWFPYEVETTPGGLTKVTFAEWNWWTSVHIVGVGDAPQVAKITAWGEGLEFQPERVWLVGEKQGEWRFTRNGNTGDAGESKPLDREDGNGAVTVPAAAQEGAPGFARVAFLQCEPNTNTWGIWAVGADGSHAQCLARFEAWWARDLAASPDGALLAFQAQGQTDGLHICDVRSGTIRRLGPLQLHGPSWAPDSRRLVTMNGGPLQIWTADGASHTESRFGGCHAPCWSPSGDEIAYAKEFMYMDRGLAVAKADLTSERQTINLKGATNPSWSPDGKRLAFAYGEDGAPDQVYTALADGSQVTRITDLPRAARFPCWSPDGHAVAFAYDSPPAEVWVVGADGTNARKVATGAHPRWSPDGQHLAFRFDRGDDDDPIAVVRADGSGLSFLTDGQKWTDCPVWLKQGDIPRDGPPAQPTPSSAAAGAVAIPQVYGVAMAADRRLIRFDAKGAADELLGTRDTVVAAERDDLLGLALSPDAMRVAWLVRDGDRRDVTIVSLATDDQHRVQTGEGDWGSIAWMPDSSHVLGARDSTTGYGTKGFWMIDPRAGDTTQLSPASDGAVLGGPVPSPDGKYVAATWARHYSHAFVAKLYGHAQTTGAIASGFAVSQAWFPDSQGLLVGSVGVQFADRPSGDDSPAGLWHLPMDDIDALLDEPRVDMAPKRPPSLLQGVPVEVVQAGPDLTCYLRLPRDGRLVRCDLQSGTLTDFAPRLPGEPNQLWCAQDGNVAFALTAGRLLRWAAGNADWNEAIGNVLAFSCVEVPAPKQAGNAMGEARTESSVIKAEIIPGRYRESFGDVRITLADGRTVAATTSGLCTMPQVAEDNQTVAWFVATPEEAGPGGRGYCDHVQVWRGGDVVREIHTGIGVSGFELRDKGAKIAIAAPGRIPKWFELREIATGAIVDRWGGEDIHYSSPEAGPRPEWVGGLDR